jgi:hypothetical protein
MNNDGPLNRVEYRVLVPLRLSVMAGTAMGVEETFENASEIDRRLVHRKVTGICDEGELRVFKPGPQRLSQVLLLKTREILASTDYQHRRADLGTANLIRKSVSSHIR